jgi:tRNA A-37 threonylcarbamoyl transferase component Bud32
MLSPRILFTCILLWQLINNSQYLIVHCYPAQQQANITQTNATLSQARWSLAAASSGELVFFGGGWNGTTVSGTVDIYNTTNGSWTTGNLTFPRTELAAASSENLVFFAGGTNYGSSNRVDIYNISGESWSTATLSQKRADLAATSVGNLVLFGGGDDDSTSQTYYNTVDIYNVTNNTWTTAALSQARCCLAATSVANRYALFAGGWNGSGVSNIVDIYDSFTGMWSTAALSQPRKYLAAASVGNLAFFGGGLTSGNQPSDVVDIFNSVSRIWFISSLIQSRYYLAAASVGEIIAFGGGTLDGSTMSSIVDIYNVTSSSWLVATLSQSRYALAATSSTTNQIFFGGGATSSSSSGASNIVDIFDIPLPPPPPPPLSQVPISPPVVATLSPFQTTITSISGPSFHNTTTPSAIFPSLTSGSLPPPSNSSAEQSSSTLSNSLLGAIIGSYVSLVVLNAATIIIFIVIVRKLRKKNKKIQQNSENNTKQRQQSQSLIVSQRDVVKSDEATVRSGTETETETETMEGLIPSQIPFNELEIGKEIGQGNYGRVCVGKWKQYRVALKFCQSRGKMDEFMREANLMIKLPPHPNVVQMYGVSIDGTQPIIVMEYCGGGSLDKLLFDTEEHISDEQKIRWLHEIALGMCHLHKHNIIHRDLAARNILLSQQNLGKAQPKIADFGMSRVLEQTASKANTLNKMGPIRWMAPESLAKQVYSKKSDMWMFAMLVYEVVARCEPHVDKDPNEAAARIRDEGLTPTIPGNCPPKLRELMQMCWKMQPEQRPSFEAICAMLEQ